MLKETTTESAAGQRRGVPSRKPSGPHQDEPKRTHTETWPEGGKGGSACTPGRWRWPQRFLIKSRGQQHRAPSSPQAESEDASVRRSTSRAISSQNEEEARTLSNKGTRREFVTNKSTHEEWLSKQKENNKRGDLGPQEGRRKWRLGRNSVSFHDSKLYLMVETEIITLSDIALSVRRGIIEEN